eukprot:TRINITY_DN3301_c0_g1_i1.p1 TRINITY_DN3301_c0_g1~~TRINITY_DN3301_c0_g1_i1.p1  ORF type:complete len:297 (-),score=39.93 TRINITY_DN3301_c0_g1_i1:149-1039(-)
MANQPKRVTLGEFKTFEFMLPEKKKDRNSCVVGAGHDFWKGHEILERRKLRDLPAKTHALLALGRAVEMRAAVEEYMSEPVTQVPVTTRSRGNLARRGQRRPLAPKAPAARPRRPPPPARQRSSPVGSPGSRRPPPPARQRSSFVGSSEVRQVPIDAMERSLDDQDADVLPLLQEGLDASPLSDSDGDEGDETMALVNHSEVSSASATDTSSEATSQAKRDPDVASHESFAASQVVASPDEDTSVQKRIVRHRFRAFTVPARVASSLRAGSEAPAPPVPPSSGVERSRPSVLLRRT